MVSRENNWRLQPGVRAPAWEMGEERFQNEVILAKLKSKYLNEIVCYVNAQDMESVLKIFKFFKIFQKRA